MMLNDTRLPTRFWAKIRVTTQGCWEWTGARNSLGYGDFFIAGTKHEAPHRVAFRALVGAVPKGMELDHLCRNPACSNPLHLEPVTHAENVRRGHSGVLRSEVVTACPRGHAYAGENLYVDPSGTRFCRACVRARKQSSEYREKNRRREAERRARLREAG